MRRLFLTLGLLSIAEPTWAEPTTEPAPAKAALFSQEEIDNELKAARSWLELSLIDYESARFRDVRVVLLSPDRRNRGNVILAVCGMANARNRMGGYVGFERFYYGRRIAFRQGVLGVLANGVCAEANSIDGVDYTDRVAPRGGQ